MGRPSSVSRKERASAAEALGAMSAYSRWMASTLSWSATSSLTKARVCSAGVSVAGGRPDVVAVGPADAVAVVPVGDQHVVGGQHPLDLGDPVRVGDPLHDVLDRPS